MSLKKIIIKTSWVINDTEKINKEIFKYIDIIQIPCNSLKEDNFNYIYWNNKAFIKYKIFLAFLEENKISEKLFFHTVILKNNYLDIPEILLFLHSKFFIRKLFLIYPIKPYNEIKWYYWITVTRKEIKNLYKEFIDKWVFELINFDKTIKYYEENNF